MTTVAASAMEPTRLETAPPIHSWKSVTDPAMIVTASSGTPALDRKVVIAVTPSRTDATSWLTYGAKVRMMIVTLIASADSATTQRTAADLLAAHPRPVRT